MATPKIKKKPLPQSKSHAVKSGHQKTPLTAFKKVVITSKKTLATAKNNHKPKAPLPLSAAHQKIADQCALEVTALRHVQSLPSDKIKELLVHVQTSKNSPFYKASTTHLYDPLIKEIEFRKSMLLKTLIDRGEKMPVIAGGRKEDAFEYVLAKHHKALFNRLLPEKLIDVEQWFEVQEHLNNHGYSCSVQELLPSERFTEHARFMNPSDFPTKLSQSLAGILLDHFQGQNRTQEPQSTWLKLAEVTLLNAETQQETQNVLLLVLKQIQKEKEMLLNDNDSYIFCRFDPPDLSAGSPFMDKTIKQLSLIMDPSFVKKTLSTWSATHDAQSQIKYDQSLHLHSLFNLLELGSKDHFKKMLTFLASENPSLYSTKFNSDLLLSKLTDVVYEDKFFKGHGLLSFAIHQKYYDIAEYLLDQGVRPLCTLHQPSSILHLNPSGNLMKPLLTQIVSQAQSKTPLMPSATLVDKLKKAIIQEGITHHGQTESHMASLLEETLSQQLKRIKSPKVKAGLEKFILNQIIYESAGDLKGITHSAATPKRSARRL